MDGQIVAPSREDIAKRAYQIWEERGRPIGSADVDWYEAERQLQPWRGELAVPPMDLAPDLRPIRRGSGTKRRRS